MAQGVAQRHPFNQPARDIEYFDIFNIVIVYGDFAGYSLIAIGLGRILGFDFGVNFKRPYFAVNFSDFWRRWHISLSSWLRDYLYIPLGGNKKGSIATYRNLFTTMLLGGLWHGASWNFVIWGGLHGLYLSVERFLGFNKTNPKTDSFFARRIFKIGYMFLVFCLVSFAWIFFRAENINVAQNFIQGLIVSQGGFFFKGKAVQLIILALICLLVVANDFVEERSRKQMLYEKWWNKYYLIWLVVVFFALLIFGKFNNAAFIYFQF